MLEAFSIGPKMVLWIEQAGYNLLSDFEGAKALDVAFRIEVETDIKLNMNGVVALKNLIAHANAQSGL